ncbi:GNAT family N-acetyltransferase [Hyphomicrobium sp.]|uniref:GNAT family N-acetyltransferase n=1 Tax=Hyphomicrobium sp. TaxID=82 RepID=UPI001E049F70|nr:GNAT family N-acetyltransferase [Hyphomicrobium sp.]MBY0559991.1 GNAT family N-acetyltransferase [Hyphomicrobium sp.]
MSKIVYNRSCANTDAFALLVEGWNELVQDGFTPDGLASPPISAEKEVLFAVSKEGDIVGTIAFDYVAGRDALVIALGYVEASSRRKGVFTELYAALKARATEAGVKRILIPVAPNNAVALAVLAKLGSVAESVLYAADTA